MPFRSFVPAAVLPFFWLFWKPSIIEHIMNSSINKLQKWDSRSLSTKVTIDPLFIPFYFYSFSVTGKKNNRVQKYIYLHTYFSTYIPTYFYMHTCLRGEGTYDNTNSVNEFKLEKFKLRNWDEKVFSSTAPLPFSKVLMWVHKSYPSIKVHSTWCQLFWHCHLTTLPKLHVFAFKA